MYLRHTNCCIITRKASAYSNSSPFFLSFMRISFLFCIAVLFIARNNKAPKPVSAQAGTAKVIDNPKTDNPKKTIRPHEPQSDGSYERFMDSLLSKKDFIFSKEPVEGGVVCYYFKQWRPYQKKPKMFHAVFFRPPISTSLPISGTGDYYTVSSAFAVSFLCCVFLAILRPFRSNFPCLMSDALYTFDLNIFLVPLKLS